MATHYIPRNVKGEGRLLYIFSTKSLITTAVGGSVGLIFYFIFKILALDTVGWILFAFFAVIGFACRNSKNTKDYRNTIY